jgi:ABC-type lipoprotein release transport system permease subunit
MDDGLLLARMILAVATLIFALSVMHSANAELAAQVMSLINGSIY